MAYVRCRVCGYVMEEGSLKDKCPACGVLKQAFDPYTEKLSPQRKFILDQHIHPIIVHFPQVFVVLLLFFSLGLMFLGESWRQQLLFLTGLVIVAFPFSVAGALLSGLFDGKIRFKRLDTPMLINKMLAGGVMQAASVIMLLIYLFYGLTETMTMVVLLLTLVCTGCSVYLGRNGASLMGLYFPGK